MVSKSITKRNIINNPNPYIEMCQHLILAYMRIFLNTGGYHRYQLVIFQKKHRLIHREFPVIRFLGGSILY